MVPLRRSSKGKRAGGSYHDRHPDLGIAAARTCPGDEIMALEGDFHRINDVLASLIPEVKRELDETPPELPRIPRRATEHCLERLAEHTTAPGPGASLPRYPPIGGGGGLPLAPR
jgi:hypothetical protein